MPKKLTKHMTQYVLYYEIFEHKDFLSAVWHSTRQRRMFDRLLLIGAAKRWTRKFPIVEKNRLYQLIYTQYGHGPFGRVSFRIRTSPDY